MRHINPTISIINCNEFLTCILSKGKIRIIKLKNKIITFLLIILMFVMLLKLNIAYNEKITEKQFNANDPNIIKIGNDRSSSPKKIFILLLIFCIIIYNLALQQNIRKI